MNCNIIKDLLPLYIDDCCSDETRELVKEHLEACEECNALYLEMSATPEVETAVSAPRTMKRVNDWRASIMQSLMFLISFALITVGVALEAGTDYNDFTNGFGPEINFKMQVTTTAFVDFRQKFESAGINQVLHIITVDIRIKGNLVIAGYNKGIETKTSAIAAQTVIVGKSPDAFTNVVESPTDNTGGLINDYGAIVE